MFDHTNTFCISPTVALNALKPSDEELTEEFSIGMDCNCPSACDETLYGQVRCDDLLRGYLVGYLITLL